MNATRARSRDGGEDRERTKGLGLKLHEPSTIARRLAQFNHHFYKQILLGALAFSFKVVWNVESKIKWTANIEFHELANRAVDLISLYLLQLYEVK